MRFEEYASACYPGHTTILGLTLKPFSLGHYILMKRFGCAYAAEGESKLDFGDFLLGLIICSKTYEENVEFWNAPPVAFWSLENIKSFGVAWYMSKRAGRVFWDVYSWGKQLKRLIKKDKRFNIFASIERFNKYITDGQKLPLFFELDSKSAPSNAHWSTSLKITMMGEIGYTESQVYNTPLVQLFAEYCKYAESQGAIELMSDGEEELARISMQRN